jgi:PAS domain S-box-containing protein
MDEQVVITDPQGVILYVNKEVERVTGYSPSEVIGQKPSLWGGRMPPEFYKNMWSSIIEKKEGFLGRVTNRHKSGQLYDALLRISPVLDSLGEIKILVGFESVMPKPPPEQ